MKPSKITILVLLLGTLAGVETAVAERLELDELDRFNVYLECSKECRQGKVALLGKCLLDKGCTGTDPNWEKNQLAPIDEIDFDLALVEYWDDGAEDRICYIDDAVVPAAQCGLQHCLKSHSAEACQDADEDGLFKWQEDVIGTSDDSAEVLCNVKGEYCGFKEQCSYQEKIGASICEPRECGNSCTAFHLEKIAENNSELIVHLYYDYSPKPATILDLYLQYDNKAMVLLDARPLLLLTEQGKNISVSHTSNGMMRLVVLGTGSTLPIPSGAIVELVFNRISSQQTSVGFTTDDYAQTWSMAPDPGARKDELKDDSLWGNAVHVSAADPNGKRITLLYSFDNAAKPLDYSDAKNGEELCTLVSECNGLSATDELGKERRVKRTAMLSALQRGVVQSMATIEGVSGPGIFLDGNSDHLELPLTVNDPQIGTPYDPGRQSFSYSTWFYAEGGDFDENSPGQILFSHNTQSEITKFGVMLQPGASPETVDLVWFEGDIEYSKLDTMVVAEGLPVRKWAHFGMTLDAATREVTFYVDGEPTQTPVTLKNAPSIQCPGFEPSPGTGLKIHQEGDFVGGVSPDVAFFASSRNNLFGIEQMDLNGMSRREIIRPVDHTSQDPHYSPIVDKIVYSSSASGAYEIWIANGDGSNPRQITSGFGDTARGIFARRPKWAPDASGIIFESNTYDMELRDNLWSRTYQLYYIGYDAKTNQVAVPLASGAVATELVYEDVVRSIIDYRLTTGETRNHNNVVWLKGRYSETAGDTSTSYLGSILVNTSDKNYKDHKVASIVIPDRVNSAQSSSMSLFAKSVGEIGAEVSMLDAYRVQKVGQEESSKMLLKKEWVSYQTAAQFEVHFEYGTDTATAVITHTPSGYYEKCWDKNLDNVRAADEDRNKDNVWDISDCYPVDVRTLYLTYDSASLIPDIKGSTPGAGLAEAAPGVHKKLELRDGSTVSGAYVKVEVQSPYNSLPIPAGAEIARVVFKNSYVNEQDTDSEAIIPDMGSIGLSTREIYQELYIKDMAGELEPVRFDMPSTQLEQVLAAAFSPEGDRLLLAGIQNARPVLVKTKDLSGTTGMEKISLLPMKVEGLQWVKLERYYPCNWIGAYRDAGNKLYKAAFRGGLDEVKLYSYVREEGAFRSEAERGLERLKKEGRDGTLTARDIPCTSHGECAPYQLCVDGKCTVTPCNPEDPYACRSGDKAGVCTLMPVPAKAGESDFEWVCSFECSYDTQCFEQECLSGPCRFCESTTDSCIECRPAIDKIGGGIELKYVEGCPDRNSFSCDDGSCMTECYSFDNGVSTYLCDKTTQYCKQGRCVLFDWDWTDFAPATFSGLGESSFDIPGTGLTAAVPQLWPVEIQAYGVEDYDHPPEVLVQGKAKEYGGDWFDIGQILVYNKDKTAAGSNPYILQTPYKITELRLRLITSPYENLNAASSGLMSKDEDFCLDLIGPKDKSACTRRAAGSRASLGYRIGIPLYESRAACFKKSQLDCAQVFDDAMSIAECEDRKLVGCDYVEDVNRGYLYGGQPAVIFTEIKVNSTSVRNGISKNTVCSWQGFDAPTYKENPGAPTVNRKVFFGDVSMEQSNQKDHFFNSATETALVNFLTKTNKAWALLNCNLANENDASEVAEIVATVSTTYDENEYGIIVENANSCLYTNGIGGKQTKIPCYEWIGGDVSMDYLSAELEMHNTVDYDLLRGFGYEESQLRVKDE